MFGVILYHLAIFLALSTEKLLSYDLYLLPFSFTPAANHFFISNIIKLWRFDVWLRSA